MKEVKNYYDNRQISEHFWVDEKGNYHGEYKLWYRNGQICKRHFYKNGLLEDEHKSWHDNGQLSYHCFFKNGLKEGEYKAWNEDGQLIVHRFYKNGLFDGEYKSWYKDGQLEIHCFFHNDVAVDITEYVADKNNITNEEYFHLQLVFGYFPIIKIDGKLQ